MFRNCSILVLAIFALSVFASESDSGEEKSPKISVSGNGFMMFGQVVSGHSHGNASANQLKNHWQNFYSGRINAVSMPTDWFTTKISIEAASAWPILRESTIMKESYKLQYRAVLPQAVGIFHFNFDNDILSSVLVESGMMEYAFNPEVKNLGNYMFRSTVYPLTMVTRLDYIYSNLLGIRAETGLIKDQLKVGGIINSIISQAPFFDMSLSFYSSFTTPNKLIDAAVGVSFERLIPINDTLTKCLNFRSTLGDTTLTLQGTKLDARITFDVKKLFNTSIFGPNDAKIYGEAAILGFKDPDYFPDDSTYPKPNLMHRIPLMFGVNFPTFKILDLFSGELEYCSYPYSIDWWGYTGATPSPKPRLYPDTTWRTMYQKKDNLKWTLYIKKSISKFDFIGMVANDHIRYETHNAEQQTFTEQSLRKDTDWQWYIKLQYNL